MKLMILNQVKEKNDSIPSRRKKLIIVGPARESNPRPKQRPKPKPKQFSFGRMYCAPIHTDLSLSLDALRKKTTSGGLTA